MATKEGVKILGIKWWHFIGGGGTVIGILLAGVALWQHFDLKAHDQRILDETKATIESNKADIAINVPDVNIDINVDETAKAIGGAIEAGRQDVAELSAAVSESIGNTASATSDTIANYWDSKKDIFAMPSIFGGDEYEDEEINVCHGLEGLVDASIYEVMCN